MKAQKEYYKWTEFAEDVEKIVAELKKNGRKFDGVFGVPRGGLILAVCLSHRLGIPLLASAASKNALVVDDIADSGATLKPRYGKNFIVTIYYHRQSAVVPDIWLREKTDKWVVFPWEAE
jgi:hypoxanthine phosphoribosyltransferase